MDPIVIEIIISVATVILSVCTSAFIAGTRWGRVEGDIKSMSDRLARIEGMFTLTLKGPHDGNS